MKLSVESLKTGKLAPKNLKPLIKDLPSRITERADQVLLGLSHSKQAIPAMLKETLQRIESNPSDIVGRVSRQVLERAETVRKQLIEKAEESETSARWVPDWLKDVSFIRKSAEGVLNDEASEAKTRMEAKPVKARAAKKSSKESNAKASKASAKNASARTKKG